MLCPMGWRPTEITGALRHSTAPKSDVRGSFAELWRRSDLPAGTPTFVQANLSRSRAGVLRGMHFHLRQWDLWSLAAGRAQVALVDVRSTDDAKVVSKLSDEFGPGDAVLIPPGVAHGFWALEDVTLLYLVTNEYDGSDEHTFRWDDLEAGLEWPGTHPVLSSRDATAPSLIEATRMLDHSAHNSGK
jgi:dTDP-4-dehydrorhamnose 3,5-epimerase